MSTFGFGNPAGNPGGNQPSSGTSFNFNPKPGGSGFGLVSTPNTGNVFGAATSTGLSFGAPTTSQATTGLSFGAPAAVGQTAGLSFGQPSGGLSFGAPAAQATSLPFGTAAPAPTTGLTFGTGTTSGFSFGNPAATAAAPVNLFGNTGTSAAPTGGINFGGTQPAAISTGLGFGGAVGTGTQGLSFGQPTTTSGFSFGSPAPSLSFPSTLSKPLSLNTTTPATGFGLSGAAAMPTQSSGFGFGTPGATSNLLGGNQPSSGAAGGNTTLGLGGMDMSLNRSGAAANGGKPDTKSTKETQVPNEIQQTIESFKQYVKAQKGHSSEVARAGMKPMTKVTEDMDALKKLLSGTNAGLQRNIALALKLKTDTAKSLQHADMAQRTADTAPGLQYDNVAPMHYFAELMSGFERDLQLFRQEIANTEKHIQSLNQPVSLTPQELTLTIRQLHGTFVALAGKLHSMHRQVEIQKEQYLNLRKYFLKDPTNVFEQGPSKVALGTFKKGGHVLPGPTPFSALGMNQSLGFPPAGSRSDPMPGTSLGAVRVQPAFGQSILSNTGLMSGFGSPQFTDSQGFQLQKPPLGNKRGKR